MLKLKKEHVPFLPVFLPAGVADMQLLPEVLVFYSVLVLCLISQM